MKVIRIILGFYIVLILAFAQACYNIPGALAFPADLNIQNGMGKVIFVTPIGVDSRGKHCLLPVMQMKGEDFFYSKKCRDFEVGTSGTVTIVFDHDDVQFSGIILVTDRTGAGFVLLTEDLSRTDCCFPPMRDLYDVTDENLVPISKLDERYKQIISRFTNEER